MRKYLFNIIIPFLLLALIIIFYTLIPSVYKTMFIIRHLLIYMFLSYILIYSVFKAYKHLMKNRNISKFTNGLLTGFISLATVTLLVVLSQLQIKYIKEYEIPPLEACAYYDQYFNLIYTSQYRNICPELENIQSGLLDGKETLTFKVTEKPEGSTVPLIASSIEKLGKKVYKKHIMENEFEYVYRYKGVIEKVTMTSRTQQYEDDVLVQYSGYKKIIENTFEDTLVTSVQTIYKYDNVKEVPDFADIVPEVITYISVITPVENNESQYLIDLTEIKTIDGIETRHVYAKGTVYHFYDRYEYQIYAYDENDRYDSNSAIYKFTYDKLEIDREAPEWLGEKREGTFVYENEELLLNKYTRMVDNFETGLDVEVKHYRIKDGFYAVNHLSTSKITEQDYGKKVEYYYTYRYRNKKYPEVYNNGGTFFYVPDATFSLSLKEMHDYRYMLFDYTRSEHIDYYQFNPLIEGFPLLNGYLRADDK